VVRAYAAVDGDGYAVMPGGLTRVADATASPVVSTQSGGGSKDTWILSDGPVAPVSLLAPAGTPVAVERAPKDLSSRVADNLFWLGRYAERCEHLVRVFRTATSRLVEAVSIDDAPELGAMVRAMARLKLLPADADGMTHTAVLEDGGMFCSRKCVTDFLSSRDKSGVFDLAGIRKKMEDLQK